MPENKSEYNRRETGDYFHSVWCFCEYTQQQMEHVEIFIFFLKLHINRGLRIELKNNEETDAAATVRHTCVFITNSLAEFLSRSDKLDAAVVSCWTHTGWSLSRWTSQTGVSYYLCLFAVSPLSFTDTLTSNCGRQRRSQIQKPADTGADCVEM